MCSFIKILCSNSSVITIRHPQVNLKLYNYTSPIRKLVFFHSYRSKHFDLQSSIIFIQINYGIVIVFI